MGISYSPLENEDRAQDGPEEKQWLGHPSKWNCSRIITLATMANIALFFLSCGLFYASIERRGSPKALMKQVSPFTPMVDLIPLDFETRDIRGTLFNDASPPIIYRQDPSPEVDEAWNKIAKIEIVGVGEENIRRMGKDPTLAVTIPEEWGLGSGIYPVEIDGQHHLHCLNTIRQFAHFDYYFSDRFANTSSLPPRHRAHLGHCLDIVLQALTCSPSLDLIPHVWMETQQHPYPDFNIKRQCSTHDSILKWQKKVAIPGIPERWSSYVRPKGAQEVSAEPSLYNLSE